MKEAKIIAMTCTHAALKRRDLVELGFKASSGSGMLMHFLCSFTSDYGGCLLNVNDSIESAQQYYANNAPT